MKPAAGKSSAEAAAAAPEAETDRDVFDSKSGREDDALLGWGSRSSTASSMIPSTVARGKRGSKLTGGSGDRGGTAAYTEGPLGSGARSRMASYDSATTLGLPRCMIVWCYYARFSWKMLIPSWRYLLLVGDARVVFGDVSFSRRLPRLLSKEIYTAVVQNIQYETLACFWSRLRCFAAEMRCCVTHRCQSVFFLVHNGLRHITVSRFKECAELLL